MEYVHSSDSTNTLKVSNLDKSAPRRVTLSPFQSCNIMSQNLEHQQRAQDALIEFLARFQDHRLTENRSSALTRGVVSGRFQRKDFEMIMKGYLANADLGELNKLFDAMQQQADASSISNISNTSSISSSLTSGGSRVASGAVRDLIIDASALAIIENDEEQVPVVNDDAGNQEGDPHHNQELVQEDEAPD